MLLSQDKRAIGNRHDRVWILVQAMRHEVSAPLNLSDAGEPAGLALCMPIAIPGFVVRPGPDPRRFATVHGRIVTNRDGSGRGAGFRVAIRGLSRDAAGDREGGWVGGWSPIRSVGHRPRRRRIGLVRIGENGQDSPAIGRSVLQRVDTPARREDAIADDPPDTAAGARLGSTDLDPFHAAGR